MYKLLIRPLLFLFDPEKVHHFTFSLIRFLNKIGFGPIFKNLYEVNNPKLEREVFGIKFKNPVGLAAGFDKDAKLYQELSNFGFGFIEIGTLTPKPQDGNPKKRLFRLKTDSAIINRMGFNNGGVEDAVLRLKKNKGVLIGGNIGKNKVTPNEEAVKDYEICFEALFPYVDYFVVNVSSPNTPNLRELQDKEPLTKLLQTLQNLNNEKSTQKPILLKIAPDLTDEQLLDIIDIVKETKIAGVIATNTTISREGLQS
ncbi:MAG: quinone-dependent dihydroorotate dehydrogenase, partial [Flavobacteriaceae bacterium]|nr:quinone-dependent dihydroorotate dehydrogenase [Flavobacteriaceae bacterium]